MSKNEFNPYKSRKQKKSQIGRGVYGRFRGSYMIPVNANTAADNSTVSTSLVTPVAAAAERAMSQMKEEKENRKPHVKLFKRIKKGKSKKRVIKKQITKRTTSRKQGKANIAIASKKKKKAETCQRK